MSESKRDLVVVGAGPAGLTAGIYGARSGLKTLVLEMAIPGGLIAKAAIVENYPGFPEGVRGSVLAKKLKDQCEKAGAEIRFMERVLELNLEGKTKRVKTDKGTYDCAAVIIATGSQQRQLGILGETKFQGRGVSYCAICDGPLFKNKNVIVVGGGNAAAIDALFLSDIASSVKLVHRQSALRAENALVMGMTSKGIEILYNTEIKEIKGGNKGLRVTLNNNKSNKSIEINVDGVFVQIGRIPNSEIAKKAGLKLDKKGYIIVDSRNRTNIDGVFAAGDVTTSPFRQCGIAIGNAVVAALEAHGYIKRPYYYRE